jgi:hypothetical protein
MGALQPASSASSRLRSAVTAATLASSVTSCSRAASSASPARHSTASAPWPGAGSISSGSKTCVIAPTWPILARPA